MDEAKRAAPAGKTWLTLHFWQHSCDETAVVHAELGAPIPFVWLDHETLEIDDIFADVATIKVIPKPNRTVC